MVAPKDLLPSEWEEFGHKLFDEMVHQSTDDVVIKTAIASLRANTVIHTVGKHLCDSLEVGCRAGVWWCRITVGTQEYHVSGYSCYTDAFKAALDAVATETTGRN